MNVTLPKATPNSLDGGVLVDGLWVNDKGHTEPVFIIRASEPAALSSMVAILHEMRGKGYSKQVIAEVESQYRVLMEWRATSPERQRVPDVYVVESQQKAKQDDPKKK